MLSHNPRRTSYLSNMAVRIRNDSWKNDHDLEDILRKHKDYSYTTWVVKHYLDKSLEDMRTLGQTPEQH